MDGAENPADAPQPLPDRRQRGHGGRRRPEDGADDRLARQLVSLSLDPPLGGFAISRDAAMHELLREAGGCAISFLAAGQEWPAQHFARGVPPIAMWEDRVRVRIECSARLATKWAAAVELARRASGEQLSTWEAAEAIAAEAASTLGAPEVDEEDRRDERLPSRSRSSPRVECSESGLRALRWPWLRWDPPSGTQEAESVESDLGDATPLELDRRFRGAIAFLQRVDFEIGRILRQILERGLYRELGFESFEDYVVERLDLSPRTARRLVRLARAPETVATAFREGRITLLAAEAILRGAPLDETVTLRKLQEQVRPEVDFWAPRSVARLFLAMVARVGLERLLDHAITTWLALAQPGHEVFERDRWWCTAPGCSARRNLHRHHIVYRSHEGPDEPWNLTTLCAWHHQRGVHAGWIRIVGRASDELVFDLPVGRFRSGDRRVAIFAPKAGKAALAWAGSGR